MCGISGYISNKNLISKDILEKMSLTLKHRGPDNFGSWISENQKIGLSHSRLSIIDISEMGKQPMISMCGRYVLVFNGEIYNHQEIYRKLQNKFGLAKLRGHSDTEVLLESFSLTGLVNTLKNIRGMFSLALWDKYKKCLYLARDRIGEKPLYYGTTNDKFFSSELKALEFPKTGNSKLILKALHYN